MVLALVRYRNSSYHSSCHAHVEKGDNRVVLASIVSFIPAGVSMADSDTFLFTSESVGEGHPGKCASIWVGLAPINSLNTYLRLHN